MMTKGLLWLIDCGLDISIQSAIQTFKTKYGKDANEVHVAMNFPVASCVYLKDKFNLDVITDKQMFGNTIWIGENNEN